MPENTKQSAPASLIVDAWERQDKSAMRGIQSMVKQYQQVAAADKAGLPARVGIASSKLSSRMGLPVLVLFLAGGTAFGLRGPSPESPRQDVFSPHRVGIDHIALACTEETELERVADALKAAGVENTGAKLDPTLGKRYVAFKDPDRIAWEFYMA